MTTSSEWLAAFGLRVSPFFKEIDDADLWLPESKAALVTDIEQALDERQSVLLLGEPGVGGTDYRRRATA
jgi:general secretion pathway protein A